MRILITGVSTRALAESAKRAGYDFLTLDYFGDYDQKSWCENYSLKRDFGQAYGPAGLYEASRRLKYDAVVYTASLENAPRIVGKLAAGAGRAGEPGWNARAQALLGNTPEVLARVRHGPTLFGFLISQGPAPLTLEARQAKNLKDPPAEQRWLRKPIRSGGGHDISFWPGNRPPGAGFVLQQYVPGRSCSAAFIANGRDAVVLGMSEQWIGRAEFGGQDFAYCGNLYPLPGYEGAAGAGLVGDLTATVTALTREFGLVGLNGLDFVLSQGRAWPVEVNPRYSASMELVELATGLSMFDWHVRSTRDGELPGASDVSHSPRSAGGPEYYGRAILYAERDCRAPDTTGWADRGIRDVPFPGEWIAKGSPICTLLASGATAGACHAGLAEFAEHLKGELYA